MIRTIFRIEPEEKDWLRRCSLGEGVPMAEVVRRALRQYRVRRDSPEPEPSQFRMWDDSEHWQGDGDG